MNLPRLRPLSVAALLALPVLAQAHPGHDGDHDVIWEFGHLVEHPIATLACLSVIVAAGWAVRRMVKGQPAAKSERTKRD